MPATSWVLFELGLPDDRLLRIVNVRQLSATDAWVTLEVDSRQIVVGLRREPCAAGTCRRGDGCWYRLLYLYGTGSSSTHPLTRPTDAMCGGAGGSSCRDGHGHERRSVAVHP